jgi:methionine synthase I (cobalamin-dependent)
VTSAAETAAAARERAEALAEILAERILVLDGATGTWLQGENLTAADFGGEQYEGCNEHLVLTRPDVVRKMHESYLEAGADMVETDTFGGALSSQSVEELLTMTARYGISRMTGHERLSISPSGKLDLASPS